MGIPYLNNLKWSDITRDERFFCSVLYHHASTHPALFAEWLIKTTNLPIDDLSGEWDLGYEVCFYRDFRWHHGKEIKDSDFSQKRTFDLCLFGENSIVIIEAKAFEGFSKIQLDDFERDRRYLVGNMMKDAGYNDDIIVKVVSLSSSEYTMKEETKSYFDSSITWKDLSVYFDDKLLMNADELYSSKVRKLQSTKSPSALHPLTG